MGCASDRNNRDSWDWVNFNEFANPMRLEPVRPNTPNVNLGQAVFAVIPF